MVCIKVMSEQNNLKNCHQTIILKIDHCAKWPNFHRADLVTVRKQGSKAVCKKKYLHLLQHLKIQSLLGSFGHYCYNRTRTCQKRAGIGPLDSHQPNDVLMFRVWQAHITLHDFGYLPGSIHILHGRGVAWGYQRNC